MRRNPRSPVQPYGLIWGERKYPPSDGRNAVTLGRVSEVVKWLPRTCGLSLQRKLTAQFAKHVSCSLPVCDSGDSGSLGKTSALPRDHDDRITISSRLGNRDCRVKVIQQCNLPRLHQSWGAWRGSPFSTLFWKNASRKWLLVAAGTKATTGSSDRCG